MNDKNEYNCKTHGVENCPECRFNPVAVHEEKKRTASVFDCYSASQLHMMYGGFPVISSITGKVLVANHHGKPAELKEE